MIVKVLIFWQDRWHFKVEFQNLTNSGFLVVSLTLICLFDLWHCITWLQSALWCISIWHCIDMTFKSKSNIWTSIQKHVTWICACLYKYTGYQAAFPVIPNSCRDDKHFWGLLLPQSRKCHFTSLSVHLCIDSWNNDGFKSQTMHFWLYRFLEYA